jgi:hypothetical protein
MNGMPPMLAYTIYAGLNSGSQPSIAIGQGPGHVRLWPSAPADDTYWIVILDANDPKKKVHEFIVPGQNNTAIPAGLDSYMSNPGYLFVVVTQYLNILHVPQGDVGRAAVWKRRVGLFYRQRQQIGGVADVMLGYVSGVEDHEIDRDFLGLQGLALRIDRKSVV